MCIRDRARKEKEAKKKQKVVELKEIRLSPNIDLNDLNTKMNAAKKFLSKGDKAVSYTHLDVYKRQVLKYLRFQERRKSVTSIISRCVLQSL